MFETFEVTKQIRWEMGHRLSLHKGKCHNLHGHSYRTQILVESFGLDGNGMVVDFYNYKPIREWIDENLDHAFMINHADPLSEQLIKIATDQDMKLVLVNFEPTAENIAKMIAIRAGQLLDSHPENSNHSFLVRKVQVWETEDCTATFTDRRITLAERMPE